MNLKTDDPIIETQNAVEKRIFDCSLAIKKHLPAKDDDGIVPTSEIPGAKPCKLELPTFYRDILNRKRFWEYRCIVKQTS